MSVSFPSLHYMSWAKAQPRAAVNLARSGVDPCPPALLGRLPKDLVTQSSAGYGYPPLLEALARRYRVGRAQVFSVSGGTSLANWLACAALLTDSPPEDRGHRGAADVRVAAGRSAVGGAGLPRAQARRRSTRGMRLASRGSRVSSRRGRVLPSSRTCTTRPARASRLRCRAPWPPCYGRPAPSCSSTRSIWSVLFNARDRVLRPRGTQCRGRRTA